MAAIERTHLTTCCKSSRILIWWPPPSRLTPAFFFLESFLPFLAFAADLLFLSCRLFSACSKDSACCPGLAGLSVISPSLSVKVRSPSSLPSPSFRDEEAPIVRRMLESSSSSDDIGGSSENGKRPSASSMSVMPSDQTSDLTVYSSPWMRSGCPRS